MEITNILQNHGANGAIIKELSKNHNDKNQVYSGSDFQPLYPYFEFEFSNRTGSVSSKKGGKHAGKPILEARFKSFFWIDKSGAEIPAKNLKMIIYPQYPEARLSGFDPVDGNMPPSLSIAYTKANPEAKRYLLIARRGQGEALGMMIVNPLPSFADEIAGLGSAPQSRVWKKIQLNLDASSELKTLLSNIVSRTHDGCRLVASGETVPFNGTQVCGFTLEKSLGIIPNSDKHGDFKGIELKTHTQKKVTLFTPEPDLGLYNKDFKDFMLKYGYQDGNGAYRLTGIHKCGIRCDKSGLTLSISNYDPFQKLASQADREIIIGLYSDDNFLAAGWSLPRLLNSWGAKHNEVVYVPSSKQMNLDEDKREAGYKFSVSFKNHVLWCRITSADKILQAIHKGTVYLDPAPKFVPLSPSETKRRSQWRVNDITTAVEDLYENTEVVEL